MSNDVTVKTGGTSVGLCGILTIIFVLAKIFDKIDWSWLWVFSPIWLPLVIIIGVLLVTAFCVLVFLAIRYLILFIRIRIKHRKNTLKFIVLALLLPSMLMGCSVFKTKPTPNEPVKQLKAWCPVPGVTPQGIPKIVSEQAKSLDDRDAVTRVREKAEAFGGCTAGPVITEGGESFLQRKLKELKDMGVLP